MSSVQMKCKAGDIVKVYRETPAMFGGGIVKVLDRDLNDKSYLVGADLDNATWVKETDCELITFDRPNAASLISKYDVFKWMMFSTIMGAVAGLLMGKI